MKKKAITVLIIDDDPGLQVSLGDILKVKGFEPIAAKSGKAALTQIKRQEIDVALIDLRLEDMPGLDVLRAIKQHSPDTEFILLTGHATQDSAIEAINLGAYSYYQKPFNIDQLILSIRHAGERHIASRALTESEARYRGLFEDSPVSLWEEDFSAVKKRLDGLRRRGVKDFRAYLKSHPQVVRECAALVQILDVNKTTLELYRAESKEDLLKNLATVLCDESYEQYREELVYIAESRTHFSWEGINQTVDGRRLDVRIYWSAALGYENDLSKIIVSIEDVTQRKQAEDALRESETRYRTLTEASQDMIFIITHDGHIDYVNQFAAKQFNRKPEELIGKRPADIFPPEVSRRQQKNLRKVFQSSEPVYAEEPTLFGEREIWLGTWLIPLDKDEAGQVMSVMGVSRDISERKQAEVKLRASEERFRSLVERSLDIITLLDVNGNVLYHSPAYSRLMGRSVEERLGRSVFEYIHPDDRKSSQEEFNNLLARPRGTVEVAARLQHKDGTYRWIEGTAINLLHDPAVQALVINYHDVTERKRVEESRQEAELRYRALFEQSHDAVFILDLQGRHLAVNPHAAEMLGYTPEEMLGLSFRDISGQVSQSEQVFDRILSGERVPLYERTFRKKNGELVPVEINVELVRDAQGRPLHIQSVVRDISERKRNEDNLRQRAEELAALQETVLSITAPHDLPGLLQAIVERASRLLKAEGGGLYLCDPHRQEVRCVVSYKTPRDYSGTVLKYGEGAAGIVAQTGHPLRIDDYSTWEGRAPVFEKERPFRALVTVPMLWQGQVVGVIHALRFTEKSPFSQADEDLLGLFANHAAIATENARLLDGLQLELTERRRTEEELRLSQEKIQNIIQHSSSMFYSHTPEHVLTFLSPQSRDLLDCEPEEAMVRWQEFLSDNPINEGGIVATEAAIQTGQRQPPYELELITRKGRKIWVRVDESPVVQDGKTIAIVGSITDITERKRAEEALQESERQYRLLFDEMITGFALHEIICDEKGNPIDYRFISVNPAFEKLTGLRAVAIVGKTVREVMPGIEAYWIEQYGQVALSGKPTQFENYSAELGKHYEVRAFCPEHGKFAVLFHDITERKRAESALRESEHFLRQTIDLVPHFIFAKDKGSRFLLVNKAVADAYGTTTSDIVGKSDIDFSATPEQARHFHEDDVAVIEGGTPKFIPEEPIMDSQGKTRYLQTTKVPFLFGPENVAGILGVAVDITERKRAEEALRESQKRFSNAFEYAAIGMALVAPDGHWLKVNQALCNIVGYSEEELLARTFQDITHPDDLEADLNYVRQMLADEIQTYQMEKRYFHKFGRIIWILLSVSLVRDSAGQPLHFIAQIQDITERKKAEEELLRRVNELEVLYESGLALSRLLEPREIGQKMMEVLSRKLAWHHAAIRLYHPKINTVEVLAVSHPGMDAEEIEKQRQRLQGAAAGLGKGLSGWVIKHGKPVRSGDVTADKRYLATYPKIRSGIYVPIQAGERTIGSIAVESETPDAFTEQDERILTTLASQAAVAFENARLYQEALRAAERRAILHRASQEISAAGLDLESVYASIHRAAAELMPFEVILIGRHDREHQEVETIYTFDSGEHYPSIRIPVGQGVSGRVVQERTSLCIQDYRKAKRGKLPAFGKGDARSILAVPMFSGVEITGVISVQSYQPGMYDQEDQALLEILAAYAGAAIENARLFDQVQRRLRESESLRQASQAVTGSLEIQPLLENILEAAQRAIPAAEKGTIMLREADGTLHIRAMTGYQDSRLLNLSFGPGESFVRQVFESQQPICIDDVHADYRVPYANQIEEVTTVQSAISAPLTVKGEKVGVISLDNASRTSAFTQDDMQLLVSFASSAAVAIQNSRLFGQTNRRAEELGALAQVSSALRTATTRAEMIPVILDQIADVFGIDDAALLSYNPSTGENVVEVARGKWTKAVGMRVPSGEGVSSVVVQTHLPFFSDNVIAEEQFAAKSLFREPEAVVGMPLLVQKQILGSLWMGRRKGKGQTQPLPFADEEVRLLGSIADMTANALHRARLHEQAIRNAEQMVTVNEVGHLLSETLDLDQIYSRLTGAIHDLLPDVCALFISLYDERTRMITCASAHVDGAFTNVKEFHPLPFDPEGSGHQSRVLLTGLPLIVNGSAAVLEEELHTRPTGDPQQKPESALYVPLFSKGASIGLIQVQSYTPNRFEEQDVNLFILVANTAAVTIENARLFVETQKRLRYLSALHNIDAAIGASVDLRVTLSIILENVTKELNVDAAAVLLMNVYTKTLEYTASRGFRARLIEGLRIRLGEGLAGQAAIQRRLVSLADAGLSGLDLFSEEGFAVQYAVPLIAKGQVQGVLQVFHRSALEPDMEWTSFLNTLAGQAAIAMDNASLFEELQRSNLELTLAYDATIQGWSQAMELRDKETQGHTERVTELTMRLAREIGLGDTETVHLRRGVLLHDIGKMGVPDSILLKPGSLTPEEWEIMRLHPGYAYEMLANITYLQQALAVPYCHHEKWDGTGYPRGLKGEQIPLAARMFAVVDVYDALTSDRPYRAAWSLERALEYLREQSGKHFDPHVLEAFLRLEV